MELYEDMIDQATSNTTGIKEMKIRTNSLEIVRQIKEDMQEIPETEEPSADDDE